MEQYIQENIVMIRHTLGYTQTEFSDIVGISRLHLGKIEANKAEVKRTLALAVMTVVIGEYYSGRRFDTESTAYQLLGHFVERFQNMIMKMV